MTIHIARVAALALVLGASVSSAALAQNLTIGVRAGPDSIDPHFTATGTHAESLKHIFDTLTWSGDKLQIEPRLATSWKAITPDTWEFKLRSGVKFHDGSDFTAEDVKFSIERIPVVSGPNPTTIYTRRVKEVKIIDPLTVHIVTDGPAPNLPNDFIRLFIVSSKAAAGLTKDNANETFNSGKAAIGTGPYKFVSWTPKDQLVLDRFDGYWGPKEPWAKVVRKELPNDAARVAQLKAGQVDIIVRAPSSDIATLKRDPKLTVATIDTVYVFNMEIDMRDKSPQVTAKDGSPLAKNPLQDPRVREAIDLAIDRPALVEIAMEGLGAPVNQLVTSSIAGFNKSLPPLKVDLVRAKKLLEEAGYPNGFKTSFSFTNDRLPGDRQVGTSVAQIRPDGGGVLPGPHARRILARHVGLGYADGRGELHTVLGRPLQRSGPEARRLQRARLQERRSRQADPGRVGRARRGQAQRSARAGQRHRRQGPAAPADRRGRLGLGDAEGQGDDRSARRRGYAGDGHQARQEVRRPTAVMVGLVPTIHAFAHRAPWRRRGCSPQGRA